MDGPRRGCADRPRNNFLATGAARPAPDGRQAAGAHGGRESDAACVGVSAIGFGAPHRLLIAPDGRLNLIPFAALVDRKGRYLVERYSISYLTSGRDLLPPPVRRPGNQDAVIVADPDYGETEGTVGKSRDVGLQDGLPQSVSSNFNLDQIYFPPLKGTADEARALKAILPQATGVYQRAGHRGCAQTTPQSWHSPRGHAWVFPPGSRDQADRWTQTTRIQSSPWSPLSSRLRIHCCAQDWRWRGISATGPRRSRGRRVLTAPKASGLDLWGTKLVVLSACDTGVGEVKNGEGVFGLRRALLLAGSETQVMRVWPVSDLGAQDLMIEYYKG